MGGNKGAFDLISGGKFQMISKKGALVRQNNRIENLVRGLAEEELG